MQRQLIGALLITASFGLFAVAILGWAGGLVCALFILAALVVAKNL